MPISWRVVKAYPRIRGGNSGKRSRHLSFEGLSPHTRGKQNGGYSKTRARGPIPAYAGETGRIIVRVYRPEAYPRIRGGNSESDAAFYAHMGLSPHTRGKHIIRTRQRLISGPIPAYAGETTGMPLLSVSQRAYPRIRGGNDLLFNNPAHGVGLSPHTRGKQIRAAQGLPAIGPIPAYAGETSMNFFLGFVLWAYPRIRGGN